MKDPLAVLAIASSAFLLSSLWLPAKGSPIGLSVAQAMQGFPEPVPLHSAHPVHGQPHFLGASTNGLLAFEAIGNPKNISAATVSISENKIHNLLTQSQARQTLIRFRKNMMPDWHERDEESWLNRTLSLVHEHPDRNLTIFHKDLRYDMYYSKELKRCRFTVTHL